MTGDKAACRELLEKSCGATFLREMNGLAAAMSSAASPTRPPARLIGAVLLERNDARAELAKVAVAKQAGSLRRACSAPAA